MSNAYNRRTRTWTKPPLGSQIDWSHPLAQGLTNCWLLNEQGGSIANDIAGRVKLTLTSGAFFGSASAGGSAPYGQGLVNSAAGSITELTPLPTWMQFTGAISIVYQGVLIGTPGSFTGLMGGSLASSPFSCYEFHYNTVGQPILGTNQNGSQIITAGIATTAGRFQLAGTFPVYAPVTRNMYSYYNGINQTSQNVFGFTIQYTASPYVYVGSTGNATVSEFGLIYNTVLTPGNIAWLYHEPYAYILPPMSTRYFSLASGTVWQGVANLVCISTLMAQGAVTHAAHATPVCASTLTALGSVTHGAHAALTCISTLTAIAVITHPGQTTLFSSSVITGMEAITRGVQATFVSSSIVTGIATATYGANATLVSTSALAGVATVDYTTSANLVNAAVSIGNAIVNYVAQATFVSSSVVTGAATVSYAAEANWLSTVVFKSKAASGVDVVFGLLSAFTSMMAIVDHAAKANRVSVSVVTGKAFVVYAAKANRVSVSVLKGKAFVVYAAKANRVSVSVLKGKAALIREIKANVAASSHISANGVDIKQTVAKISQNSPTSLQGAPFSLTVTFTTLIGTPITDLTGQVVFYDGGIPLVTVAVGIGGIATGTIRGLTFGNHSLYAAYLGGVGFFPSQTFTVGHMVIGGTTVAAALYVDPSCGSNVLINGNYVCFGDSLL